MTIAVFMSPASASSRAASSASTPPAAITMRRPRSRSLALVCFMSTIRFP